MDNYKAALDFVRLVGILCALVLTLPAPATPEKAKAHRYGPSDPGKLSLPQAVGIALNRNYQVTDARLEVRKQEHNRRKVYSSFFPTIEVEYSAEVDRYQNLTTVEYLSYGQDSRWFERIIKDRYFLPDTPHGINPYMYVTLTATLTQPIYSGGRLVNEYRNAKLGLDSARLQLEIEKQDLTLEVYQAYYEMILAHKLLYTANKSVAALQETRKQSIAFFNAGIVLEVDVLATEGQLAKARVSRRAAAKSIEKFRAKLNFLLRYPPTAQTDVIVDTKYVPNNYSVPQIFEIAARNRLEIAKANVSTEKALAMVKVAQAGMLPTAYVEVAGSRMNDDWNTFDREAYNDWTVTGVLKWTFDMFGNRETVKKRRVEHAQKFVQGRFIVQQVMEEVQLAYIKMKRAEGNIADERKSLDAYLANYRKNVALYKEQLATYREVLDAEKEAAQAAADYFTSLMNYKIYLAELERKMGILR
ncbi:TolC family protein [Thermodesulfobacteriota bacterium]